MSVAAHLEDQAKRFAALGRDDEAALLRATVIALANLPPATVACPHCGKRVPESELAPMHSDGLLGCPTCRGRLDQVEHHLHPGKHPSFDQMMGKRR